MTIYEVKADGVLAFKGDPDEFAAMTERPGGFQLRESPNWKARVLVGAKPLLDKGCRVLCGVDKNGVEIRAACPGETVP
jgi:hypothetical protein